MAISFSGLASGLDTDAIIRASVDAARQPAERVEAQKTLVQGQNQVISDLVGRLDELAEEVGKLNTPREIRSLKAEASDDAYINIDEETGFAEPGTYAVRVTSLARNEVSASTTFGNKDAGVIGTGSVDIAVGSGSAVTISYDATDSLDDIAARINDQVDGVSSSVLFDGTNYRLMVNADEAGLENSLTFSNETGASLGVTELVPPSDAVFSVNGVQVSRPTNSITDVIPGLSFELRAENAPTDPETFIRIDDDVDGLKEKIRSFIDTYNKVATLLDDQLSFSGEAGDIKGADTLFGDSSTRGLQNNLSSLVTRSFSTRTGGSVSLGFLGLELSNTGLLTLDDEKFEDAIDNNREDLEDLFAGATTGTGFASELDDLVDRYTRFGDGIFSTKRDANASRIRFFDDQIERFEERASAVQERLSRQFAALESTVGQLQNQGQFLAGL